MQRYWHVAQTYLWRPRFWIFAAAYVLLVGGLRWHRQDLPTADLARGQMILSALLASIVGCFLGLHVRRQFGTAAARLVPDFAAPHLVVAALASFVLWIGIPATGMLVGQWPTGSIALHAVGGILAGLVACWPGALFLLAALPAWLIWASQYEPHGATRLVRLADGQMPIISGMLIGLAAVLQIVAANFLLRLPRRGITTSDELTFEASLTSNATSAPGQWILEVRDSAARSLSHSKLLPSIQRWRVPAAVSWFSLLVPVAVVVVLSAFGGLIDNVSDWATLVTLTTSAVLLILPLGRWHSRLAALAFELLRPVTRPVFFLQILLAFAGDMLLWVTTATLISVGVFSIVPPFSDVETSRVQFLVGYLAILWSMAALVYGVAVLTIRWRFWIPTVAAVGLAWFLGVSLLLAYSADEIFHTTGWQIDGLGFSTLFAALSAPCGLLLARTAFHRLVAADVV